MIECDFSDYDLCGWEVQSSIDIAIKWYVMSAQDLQDNGFQGFVL